MKINVQCFGQVRLITKEAIVSIEVPDKISIIKTLDIFVQSFGKEMEKILYSEGKLRNFYFIQVDKKNVEHDELGNYILEDAQTISIIPFVAGG
ncbi:MAG: MoaD/ThiS family protein [Candidatus Thorarchaeota archaeon]